jgi:hypothetical protein
MYSQLIDIISQLKVNDLKQLAYDFGLDTKGLLKQDLVEILQTIPSLNARVPIENFDLTKKSKNELNPLTATPRSSMTYLSSVRRPSIPSTVRESKKSLLQIIIPFMKISDLRSMADEFFIRTRGLLKQDLIDALLNLPTGFLRKEYELSQFDLTDASLRQIHLFTIPKTPRNSLF